MIIHCTKRTGRGVGKSGTLFRFGMMLAAVKKKKAFLENYHKQVKEQAAKQKMIAAKDVADMFQNLLNRYNNDS